MSSTSQSNSGGSGAERRRYVRQPITLEAMISIQGRKPLPCVVRDFCVAGIFVALNPEHLHDLSKHTKATLNFSLMENGVPRDLQLGLIIFRVVGNGIGCGFSKPDANVIQLLKRFADASGADVPVDDHLLAETQSHFSAEYAKVKDELISLCLDRTAALVDDFIRVADEMLFLGARDAGNNLDETRFLDGQNEFRGRHSAIEADVPILVRKAVQIINSPISADGSGKSDDDSGSELSLIDKDDFEEFLTVAELVSELEPKFKTHLFELEKRFSHLAKREVDEHSNPIGPEVLSNVFADSLKNLQSDRMAINQIYGALKKVLDAGLGRFYDEVNQFFISNSVLPVIEKEKPGFKKKPSPPRRVPPPASDENPLAATHGGQDLSSTFGSGAYPASNTGSMGVAPPSSGPAGGAPALAPLDPSLTPPPPGSVEAPQNPNAGAAQAAPLGHPQGQPSQGVPGAAPPQYAQTGATGQYAPPGAVAPGAYTPSPAGSASVPNVGAGQAPIGGEMPGAAPPLSGGGQPGVAPPPGAVGGHPAQTGVPQGAVAGVAQSPGAPQAFDVTFGGFAGSPAVYTTPSLQQAYSTAQTQLALRRDLSQHMRGGAAVQQPSGASYHTRQIVDGLTSVQHAMAGETNPGMLEVGSIKDKIIDSIKQAGGGEGHIGQTEADAIEVIANLFKSLINDTYLTAGAKSNLARLQAPVHKVALMDEEFFEATNHPVRQVLNRVALVEDTLDEQGIGQNERLSSLIDQVNRQFSDDVSIFNPVVGELDEILLEQRRRYQENVDSVVQSSIEQQTILKDRRSKDLSATDTSGLKKELPPEWNKWLDRVKAFEVGDRFIMNANTNNPFPVSLVWIGEDGEPFVLVDQKGHKVSTLTMQQVAMYLRRGTLKLLDPNAAAAVDRALFSMVNDMHSEVEAQVTHDELTKFLTRASFIQEIDKHLSGKLKKAQGATLCQLSINNLKEINERDGVEAGDKLLEEIANILTEQIGTKKAAFGRVSGTELAVFWQKGGVQAARSDLETCIEKFSAMDLTKDGEEFELSTSIGIVAVEDDLTSAKDLLTVVSDSCTTARNSPDKSVYVAGSENKYKEKLEQMVSYVAKAVDRERLVFLIQKVRSIADQTQIPAAHVVVSAEDRNSKIIPPSLFEQAMEKSDRAFDVDQNVLKTALIWMRDDEKVLENYAAVVIPLSAAAVRRDDLADIVVAELMETAVPPGKIVFEVKDRDVASNLTEVSDMMRTLTEFGCRFILDEFGSGQDNYDYLKELPADFVTIQSNFIREASSDQKDFAMAKSINELAHFMGKRTLAKQERGADIQEILGELGVDFIFDRTRSSRIADQDG
ncbi:MAG: DUF1631 family protein [Pseudomonadota bacterium]